MSCKYILGNKEYTEQEILSYISDNKNAIIKENEIEKVDNIYINKDTADDSVLLHEFNHLYNNWLKQNRPEVYKKGLDLVKKEVEDKQKKLDLINKTNPAPNNYNTWVRSVEDIKTAEEVFETAFTDGEMYADFTIEDMKNALKLGEVTIYSSNPIKDGVFVTPSKMNAEEYAGGKGNKIYSKKVKVTDVAWLDESEGQYAKTTSEIQDIIDFVKTNQPNLEGEKLNEEILTELVGRKGLELLIEQKDKTKSSGIINWLSEVWQSIKDMLGLSSYTDEQILSMNLQDFANASAIDLLRGERIDSERNGKQNTKFTDETPLTKPRPLVEPSVEEVVQYANATEEELTPEQTIDLQDVIMSLGVNNSKEAEKKLKEALETKGFIRFNKKQMLNSGAFNKYEVKQILNSKEKQDQVEQSYRALKNSPTIGVEYPKDFVYNTSEINSFGKQKVLNPFILQQDIIKQGKIPEGVLIEQQTQQKEVRVQTKVKEIIKVEVTPEQTITEQQDFKELTKIELPSPKFLTVSQLSKAVNSEKMIELKNKQEELKKRWKELDEISNCIWKS